MASLDNLPIETLPQIISLLDSHRDVAALSFPSRNLYALCDMPTRKKYRRIRLKPSVKSFDRVFNILMDILKRPPLGRYVRHIELLTMFLGFSGRLRLRKVHENDIQLLQTAMRRAGFTDPVVMDWMMDLLLQRKQKERKLYVFYSFSHSLGGKSNTY